MGLPELIYQPLRCNVSVRIRDVPDKCCVRIHSTPSRSDAQNWSIFSDPLEVIIEYDIAFLEPTMGLERIRNDTEDDSWKRTITRKKFEQRERIEQAEIGPRIKRPKVLERSYQIRSIGYIVDCGGR